MKIQLKYIGYTLLIKDAKKAKGEVEEYLKSKNSCREVINNNSSTIWINLPIKQTEIPTLAHEVIHVLQHIARERDIDFKTEEEHFAYLMQYILNEALGYEYDILEVKGENY